VEEENKQQHNKPAEQRLSDAPIYQQILRTGRTEGIAIGKAEGLAIGERRGIVIGKSQMLAQIRKKAMDIVIDDDDFSSLISLTNEVVAAISDFDALFSLALNLAQAHNTEEAEQFLLDAQTACNQSSSEERGKAEVLMQIRQPAIRNVFDHLPSLTHLAKEVLGMINDPVLLRSLATKLAQSLDEEEAEQLLLDAQTACRQSSSEERGKAEVLIQIRQPVIQNVFDQFPSLTRLAKEVLGMIDDPVLLYSLAVKLAQAQSTEEAHQILLKAQAAG
jgi:hypothetical protein